MRRATVSLLLLTAACGGSLPRGAQNAAAQPLRVCVQNETVAYGNIVAYAGMTRYDVMSGREVCKRVIASEPTIVLRAQTTAGGAAGPLSYSTRLQPGISSCWRWRLTDSPASSGDLLPCDDAPAAGRGSDSSGIKR